MKVCLVCAQQFAAEVDICPHDGVVLDPVTNALAPHQELHDGRDAELIGQSVGGYRIESLLGHGGMGAVYLAVHSLLDKRAAIKVILGNGSLADARRRFLDEARVLAALDSPYIVAVHDLAELPDGRLYLMMEYLEGEPLSALLSRRRHVSAAEAAAIMEQTLAGLAVAHARGIVHRDVKPGNLFLAREANGAGVKLLDFGIAKLIGMAALVTTRSGAVLGSAAYMSPEQARGGAIDHRSDLYSAGVVLYELVCGRPPFEADTWLECLALHQNASAPPLPAELDVPAAFEAVVLRSLAKTPDARFASAAEMRDALIASVGGRSALPSVSAPPPRVRSPSPASDKPTVPLKVRQPAATPSTVGAADHADAIKSGAGGNSGARRRTWAAAVGVATAAAVTAVWLARPAARVEQPRDLSTDGACAGGDAGACYALANQYLSGARVSRDDGRALSLLDKACAADFLRACTQLGVLVADGHGGRRDLARSISLLESSCQRGDPGGCRELGRAYWDGHGVDVDQQRAATQFEHACTSGDQDACADLGRAYETGHGEPKDTTHARELYQAACDHSSGLACYRLALLSYYGTGTAKDLARCASLSQRACELGSDDGCYGWGYALLHGEGVDADPSRGAELMQRACEHDVIDSCTNLGKAYEIGARVGVDLLGAAALYRKACDRDGGISCGLLGRLYYYGSGVAQDYRRSIQLFEQSCHLGNAYGCYSWGYQLAKAQGVAADAARGTGLMKQACDDQLVEACAVLAAFYAGGTRVARDVPRAAGLYRQACELDPTQGCAELAALIDRGDAAPRDPSEAARLSRRACDAGVAAACRSSH